MGTIYKEVTITHKPTKQLEAVEWECDGKCGKRETNTWGWTPLVLDLGEKHEEGWAHIERIYCEDCFYIIQEKLISIGLVSHWHGGINFLEDQDCPGASSKGEDGDGKYPTPEGYGGGPYEKD